MTGARLRTTSSASDWALLVVRELLLGHQGASAPALRTDQLSRE
jgi:hypothetical protein